MKTFIPFNDPSSEIDEDVTLSFAQTAIEGYVEIVYLSDNGQLLIDEGAKIKGKPQNEVATLIAKDYLFPTDYISGHAILLTGDDVWS